MAWMTEYQVSLWAFYVIVLTWLLQWGVATVAKGSQPGAIPGKIDDSLSHDSFVFRAHRTFMNSLENLPAFLASALLAILIGVDSFLCGLLLSVYAVARLMHMALYYGIATERNPSPRSYFFVLGVMVQLGLLILIAQRLWTI